jgi:2-C-methyl-D-erythritol 4-phosphate cytidylyltransferase
MAAVAEVIIVAGGLGRRLGAQASKAFVPLGGQPLVIHALRTFARVRAVAGLVVVVPAGEEDRLRQICLSTPGVERVRAIVPGGARRQDSVRAGLDALSDRAELVLVHDAARPFVSVELIERVLTAAEETGAAVPGLPVADTLKQVNEAQRVERTLDRRNLVAVQTPQGFRIEVLRRAYAHAWEKGIGATDDAGLVEQLDLPVAVVPGEAGNFKVTTPQDYRLAQALAREGVWDATRRSGL